MNMMIIIISIFTLLLPVYFVIKVVEKDKGKYKCENCQECFKPKFKEILLSVHSDDVRYLKCPNCNEKIWCKKI